MSVVLEHGARLEELVEFGLSPRLDEGVCSDERNERGESARSVGGPASDKQDDSQTSRSSRLKSSSCNSIVFSGRVTSSLPSSFESFFLRIMQPRRIA